MKVMQRCVTLKRFQNMGLGAIDYMTLSAFVA